MKRERERSMEKGVSEGGVRKEEEEGQGSQESGRILPCVCGRSVALLRYGAVTIKCDDIGFTSQQFIVPEHSDVVVL